MDPRDAFLERAKGGGIVPVIREVVTDADTPVAAFAKIARPPFAFILESLVGGERWARYTFLGTEPREAWRYRGQQVDHWTPAAGWEKAGQTGDPVAHLADRMRALPSAALPGLPRFMGGAVGYLGYDLVRSIEHLPAAPTDTLGVPDAVVMIADSLVILDNVFGRAIVVANVEVPAKASAAQRLRLYDVAQERLDTLIGRLSGTHQLAPLALDDDGLALRPPPQSQYGRAAFERDVAKIREYIAAGDVFQAVLSRRQVVPGAVDTLRPIAGTRPRGASPAEDEALATSLREDAKELAEHRMLVDLGRNDVGRVAQYGTVRVTESLQIERYSHVQHLVSEVRGRLKEGYDALDVFRACFPAGTVSGAPKVRAMEIIDELEPERRGPYAGAVGYVGWGATSMDTAIAIRSALVLKDRVVVQAGAGIVADSDPSREFAETEAKAQAVLRALALTKAGD